MGRTIGHYAPWLLAVLVGALVAVTVLPLEVPWPLLLVLLGFAVFLGLSLLAHNRRLCERCIAWLPLDASRVAARYALRFRVAHLFQSKLFALGYLSVLAGLAVLYSHPIGRYGFAAAQASLGYLLVVYVTHQRLAPWCPYCRGGGEEQNVPTPPTPVSTRI